MIAQTPKFETPATSVSDSEVASAPASESRNESPEKKAGLWDRLKVMREKLAGYFRGVSADDIQARLDAETEAEPEAQQVADMSQSVDTPAPGSPDTATETVASVMNTEFEPDEEESMYGFSEAAMGAAIQEGANSRVEEAEAAVESWVAEVVGKLKAVSDREVPYGSSMYQNPLLADAFTGLDELISNIQNPLEKSAFAEVLAREANNLRNLLQGPVSDLEKSGLLDSGAIDRLSETTKGPSGEDLSREDLAYRTRKFNALQQLAFAVKAKSNDLGAPYVPWN